MGKVGRALHFTLKKTPKNYFSYFDNTLLYPKDWKSEILSKTLLRYTIYSNQNVSFLVLKVSYFVYRLA